MNKRHRNLKKKSKIDCFVIISVDGIVMRIEVKNRRKGKARYCKIRHIW